jgi:hypothetical protein
MANQKNTVFNDCGHKCVCSECADKIKTYYINKCPICRKEIISVIH